MPTQSTASDQNVFVGIDFGTTKTMVAIYDPGKKSAKQLTIGRGRFEKPTSMYATETGDLLFGDDADDLGITDHPNHIRRFKMKLGKPGLAHMGRKSGTAQQLTSEFLGNLRKQLEQQVLHTSVDRVVLTVPAMFGPAQRHDLTIAARQAGFSEIELLEEPVAAGIAYCDQQTGFPRDLRFIVVDWGGGTFDVAYAHKKPSGEIIVHEEFVGGLDDIGGEVFDDELWEITSSALDSAGHGTLDSQPRGNWGRYRRELSRAKENLSSQSSVSMSYMLDGYEKPAKIFLNRTDFNKQISRIISKAAVFVSQLIVRARDAGCSPEFILLAGGTSRIPLIREEIERITGVECRQWSDGREAIALGAAIKANQLWGPKTTRKDQEGRVAGNDKKGAMTKYRDLLELAWIDGNISSEAQIVLEKKRKELELTLQEAESLQIQLLGAMISQMSVQTEDDPSAKNTPSFKIQIKKSTIGLQIAALAPEAHTDMTQEELISKTHFPMALLVSIENTTKTEVYSVRISLKSSEGHQHAILIPSIKPGKSGALTLTSADLEGWMVTPGDTLTVDATGLIASVFVVKNDCAAFDPKCTPNNVSSCVVFVRKAAFSSNYVLRVINIKNQRIKIFDFQSPAGKIRASSIVIEPDSEVEIGWCELSEGRNLAAGEEFVITFDGFKDVQGVIAEGQLKSSGTIWKVLGALGGLALAAAGG